MYSNFINYIRIGEKMVLDKGKTYKGYAEYYKTLAILWIVIASQMAVIILFLTDIL